MKLEDAARAAFQKPDPTAVLNSKALGKWQALDSFFQEIEAQLEPLVKMFAIEPLDCAEDLFFGAQVTGEPFVFGVNGARANRDIEKYRFPTFQTGPATINYIERLSGADGGVSRNCHGSLKGEFVSCPVVYLNPLHLI